MAKAVAEKSLQELAQENNAELKRLEVQQVSLGTYYQQEEKVTIAISPMYAPHFGNVMPININGIYVGVPCDGRNYDIPMSFAMEARQRIAQVDEQLIRNKRLSDVTNNSERYAGERDLITLSK